MSDDNGAEPTTAEVMKALTDLRAEVTALREASPAEKQEAREDVAEATDDFAAIAKKAGLSPEQIRTAVARAKEEEDYGHFKTFMDRYVSELPDDDDDKDSGASKAGEAQEHEAAASSTPVQEPSKKKEPDAAPTREHWTDRKVMDLLR